MKYTDPESGITIQTNGSAAGESFMRAFIQAGKDLREKRNQQDALARSHGAAFMHDWNGWFGLEQNRWQCGHGTLAKGEQAKLHIVSGARPKVGELVGIIHHCPDYVSLWEVYEVRPWHIFKDHVDHYLRCIDPLLTGDD
jgi:hypothetical protein